jgi:ABC-type hemin transport system substrate-binding protein
MSKKPNKNLVKARDQVAGDLQQIHQVLSQRAGAEALAKQAKDTLRSVKKIAR